MLFSMTTSLRSSRQRPSRNLPRTSIAGCPTLRFLKGGIPRSSPAWDFLLTPTAPSFIECTDDSHHPPFSQSAKRMGHPAILAGRCACIPRTSSISCLGWNCLNRTMAARLSREGLLSTDLWLGTLLSIPIGIGTGLAGPPLQRWYKHRSKARRIRILEDQKASYYEALFYLARPEKFTQFLIRSGIVMMLAAVAAISGIAFFSIEMTILFQQEQALHVSRGADVLRGRPELWAFLLFGPSLNTVGLAVLSGYYSRVRTLSRRVEKFGSYAPTLPQEIRNIALEEAARDEIRRHPGNTQ